MIVLDILTVVLLGGGSFFALTGAVGLLRMPDFFSRLHPAGKSDSMAQLCFLMGLLLQSVQAQGWYDAGKLLAISLFLFLTTPVSTHAITQAAYVVGLEPWTNPNAPKPEAPSCEAHPRDEAVQDDQSSGEKSTGEKSTEEQSAGDEGSDEKRDEPDAAAATGGAS